MARVLMVVLTVAVTIYAVADIARTPSDQLPARIPKPMWLLATILLPPVGGLAWVIVSRVTQAEARGGEINRKMWYSDESAIKTRASNRRRESAPTFNAPDDDPEFLWMLEKELRSKRSQEEIREAERLMDEAQAAREAEAGEEDAADSPDTPANPSDEKPTEGEDSDDEK
ncbi:MAG: PLD nuclease N-terminal domain-containing protein [Actinomycetaceae bacterium]|nr:PLD nuclease N-terminal domain-containing protein [Actinomycetaceae bacterium]